MTRIFSPRAVLVACLLVLTTSAAQAGLAGAALGEVGVAPPTGARVPLQSQWKDERGVGLALGQAIDGRPTLAIFADFTCQTLCGPILTFAVDALERSRLSPEDYRLVVLGIDPKDGPADASRMKRERVADEAIFAATTFLTAGEETVRQVADAVGYRFAYDAEHDQFAHPAAVLVLAADGRLTRVLSGLGMTGNDLRLALVEASEGRIGTFADRVRTLCYGFDPRAGAYTLSVHRGLAIASALTVIALATAIGWMLLRPERAS